MERRRGSIRYLNVKVVDIRDCIQDFALNTLYSIEQDLLKRIISEDLRCILHGMMLQVMWQWTSPSSRRLAEVLSSLARSWG